MANKKNSKAADVPVIKYSEKEQALIKRLLKLIRREGRVRLRTACQKLRFRTDEMKSFLRGFMTKLVEEAELVAVVDETVTYYYANRENFYRSKRLIGLVPSAEVDRITSHVDNSPRAIDDLMERIYGRRKYQPVHFVETILHHFVRVGLLDYRNGLYSVSVRGREFGVDSQTLVTLSATALENIVASKAETSLPDPAKLTMEKLERIVASDLRAKRIPTVDLTDSLADRSSFTLLTLAEILHGNQFTDMRLLNWIRENSKPDLTLVSGLVQGNFAALQKDKRRVLTEKANLDKVGHQLTAAGNTLKALERMTRKQVLYTMGDDDVAIAADYATLAQLAEGKIWQFGIKGSLTKEQERRLWIREYYAKLRIQLEIIWPYQYRIGRALLNSKEVESRINVRKSEYRLIIEILVAKRRKLQYPAIYEKIVNVAALESNQGKRYISADALSLMVKGQEFLGTHNTNFSTVTQYVDPLYSLEQSIRQRLAAKHKVPFFTMDFHQELFYFGYLGDGPDNRGHWFMNLPGMQNPIQDAEKRMKIYNQGVLTSKSHRQNTFRKLLTIPGSPEWTFLGDGRIRLRLLNNRTRQVLHEQRNKPEVREGIAVVTDAQHGSITMVPEIELLYLDYALYKRRAKRLFENGDILHGLNYKQTFSENRPIRLTSVNSQKEFTKMLQGDLIKNAPQLEELAAWLGNHEWNTFGRALSGTNDLEFLVHFFQGIKEGQELSGDTPRLQQVHNVSRIRFARTHNPTGGDLVNWPYYARTIGGFKLAFSHLWLIRGGGRTPVDQQRKWLTGMARAAGDIDYMFGGHYHSIWGCQEAEKLCLQLASTASQSGYEFVLGKMSLVMSTYIEVSNRTGVTIEFIPWDFLYNHYEPISPFLRGRKNELRRPKPGSIDFKHGKMSPFIERMIDDCTFYTEV